MAAVSRETAGPDRSVVDALFGKRSPDVYRYVDLLTGPGVERGILGPREADRIWQRHILNCAVVAPVPPTDAEVCDLGSGAGLPGIVFALARPDLRVTLLEPLLRRVTFLAEVSAALGLGNVEVRRGRAEQLAGRRDFEVVTARAVASLDILVRWGLPLVRAGGELIAFKGENAATEVETARDALIRYGAVGTKIETYGAGTVEPLTRVVRIESSGKRPPHGKGSR